MCAQLPPIARSLRPFHTYNHSVGSAAIGGPFYTGTAYPPQYRGNFFFADYAGSFIKRVVFDASRQPGQRAAVRDRRRLTRSPSSSGPDGMIYYLSFTIGQIRRIRFNGPSRRRVGDARPTATRR